MKDGGNLGEMVLYGPNKLMENHPMITQPFKAVGAFFRAISLLFEPGLRLFVLIPLLANMALMAMLVMVAFSYFGDWVGWLVGLMPDWLGFLEWLFEFIFAGIVLVLSFYGFSVGANIIASPFNGLLAEKVEKRLGRDIPETPMTAQAISQLVVQSVLRELQKMAYFLPRAALLLILSFIPVVNFVTPFLWLLLSLWMLAIQYLDYAFDNNRVRFADMRVALRRKPLLCLSFGLIVMGGLAIPFINLAIMPVAVVAATVLWVDGFADRMTQPSYSSSSVSGKRV